MNPLHLSSYQNPEGKLRDGLVPRTDKRLAMFDPDWFKEKTVLDIGCNNGYFTRFASKSGAIRAVGVDISNAVLGARELAKKEGLKTEFWQLDVESKEFQRLCPPFDVVLLLSSLAKIKDKERFLDFLDSRTGYMLIFESNHGEVHKKDIELIKKHFYFSQLEYFGPSEIPEKPHYMWKGTRSAEFVRYKMLKNMRTEWVPISEIHGWTEESIMAQKGAYSLDSEEFKRLKEDIKERGIRQPLVLQDDHEGKLNGFQGSHRYFAAKQLGYKEVPCKVFRGFVFKHLGQ